MRDPGPVSEWAEPTPESITGSSCVDVCREEGHPGHSAPDEPYTIDLAMLAGHGGKQAALVKALIESIRRDAPSVVEITIHEHPLPDLPVSATLFFTPDEIEASLRTIRGSVTRAESIVMAAAWGAAAALRHGGRIAQAAERRDRHHEEPRRA